MTDEVVRLVASSAGPWVLDPRASTVLLQHRALWGLRAVRGSFTGLSGEGEVEADGVVRGRFEVAVSSLDTKRKRRDAHLRSARFFDVERRANIVFEAHGLSASGDREVVVSGELEVAATTRPLEVRATVTEATLDGVTFEGDVTIDRHEFGLTWNRLGMLKGMATVSVIARFVPSQPKGEKSD